MDHKVQELADEFARQNGNNDKEPDNPEYRKLASKVSRLKLKIGKTPKGQNRDTLVKELHEVSKQLRKTTSNQHTLKKLVYLRYADDWLIGVKGSKEECRQLKKEIGDFLKKELNLELSEQKTLITHSSKKVRFLGYDISIRRCQQLRVYRQKSGKKIKRRTLNHSVNLEVPCELIFYKPGGNTRVK